MVREMVGHSHGTSHRRRTGHSSPELFSWYRNINCKVTYRNSQLNYLKEITNSFDVHTAASRGARTLSGGGEGDPFSES
jgi:hypothetical protein